MPSVLVVDGIDRVGKTTFVGKFIEQNVGFKVFKHERADFGYSEMDNENETDKMLQLLEVIKLTECNIVLDRFHLSDFGYGVVERGYDSTKAATNLLLIDDRMMKLFGVNVIVIYVKPEDIAESSRQHGSDLSKQEALMSFGMRLLNVLKLTTSYGMIDETVKKVTNYLGGCSDERV